jgi:hypothetical protein
MLGLNRFLMSDKVAIELSDLLLRHAARKCRAGELPIAALMPSTSARTAARVARLRRPVSVDLGKVGLISAGSALTTARSACIDASTPRRSRGFV